MQVNRISFASSNIASRPKQVQTREEKLTQMKKYSGNPTTGFYPRLIVMSPEQRFDYEMASGTKLSNGATLVKPVILSLGKVDIKKIDGGKYQINSSTTEKTLTMTEDELLNTKWLSRGTIKKMDEDKYMLCYSDRDGENHIEETTKEGAMQIFSDNIYYM